VVPYVLQAIPLGAGLSVDLDLIIKSHKTMGTQVLDMVFQRDAPISRMTQVAHRPVKLNMLAMDNLLSGFSNNIIGQKIER
jgi:hypothetical protein